MNTIVASVLIREAARAETGTRPFMIVTLFSGLGLVVSLCLASLGWDIGGSAF